MVSVEELQERVREYEIDLVRQAELFCEGDWLNKQLVAMAEKGKSYAFIPVGTSHSCRRSFAPHVVEYLRARGFEAINSGPEIVVRW